MFVVGLILSAALIAFGVGTALRQRRAIRRLHEERFLPSDERAYLRGQVRRRLLTSTIVAIIGILIGFSYVSGNEARATAIAERSANSKIILDVDPPRPAAEPPSEDDKAFVRQYGFYWLAIVVLVALAVMCAIYDFWVTRWYWMSQYRVLKADHEAKLQRDLAVYRQAKDNDRVPGLKNPKPDDETDETPPPS
jgi:hypothetical protein